MNTPIDKKISRLFSASTLAIITSIMSKYDLWTIYEVAHVQGNASMYLPYHNTYHALSMVRDCYEGARYAGLDEAPTRALLIAALCHDLNHSGGKLKDADNIRIACQGVQSLVSEGFLSAELGEEVVDIIKVTEYPYTDVALDTEAKKIIRDADLCAMIGDSWIDHVIVGLPQELAVAGVFLEPDKLQEAYWKFYSESPRNSKWGIVMYDADMKVIKERLSLIQTALDHGLR